MPCPGYFIAGDGSIHGFVWDWEHRQITDLNSLRQPGYTSVIALANDINNDGVITGRTTSDPGTGVRYEFMAKPIAH